jgi:hypothetical protein
LYSTSCIEISSTTFEVLDLPSRILALTQTGGVSENTRTFTGSDGKILVESWSMVTELSGKVGSIIVGITNFWSDLSLGGINSTSTKEV